MHLLGGDNTELFNVQNYDVGKIFEKIRISLGLMRQVSAVNIKVQDVGEIGIAQI
jgi:hypothetical protein